MGTIRILFLAANPAGTSVLSLDEEMRSITEKIRSSEHRARLEIVSAWAVRPDDLLQSLNTYKPQIVHFSGHGSSKGEIILVDKTGEPKPVSARAIQSLFRTLKDNIRLVMFNACYSRSQGRAITEIIDCAVGMRASIGDRAAITFAASFYRALGFGRSIQEAFDQGRTALLLEGIKEEKTPVLLVRPGLDPSRIVLIETEASLLTQQRSSDDTRLRAGLAAPDTVAVRQETPQALDRIKTACETALTELFALQYPWGEWSDRRTSLESAIAERPLVRGPEGPKPNVARTVFAVEALGPLRSPFLERRQERAMAWMVQDVVEGWYREWASTQSLDSESSFPNLVRRKDVRHTAQLTTVLCRAGGARDPLAHLLRSVTRSILSSGFWPETPGDLTPRLLASVYAVEALGHAEAGSFRLPVEDLLDTRAVRDSQFALRGGLSALHREADLGRGLLGFSFTKPTPYMTGLALFRLAPLGRSSEDFHKLIEKLIRGIAIAMESNGWSDHSVSPPYRDETRKRTTLRIAAGLGLAKQQGFSLPDDIWNLAVQLAQDYLIEPTESELDSPDYACALICLLPILQDTNKYIALEAVNTATLMKSAQLRPLWVRDFQGYASRLSVGRRLGLPGYEELGRIMDERVTLLTS